MGRVFDTQTAKDYEAWCLSTEGRAIHRSLEPLFMSLLDPRPGDRVLDVGCGFGNHLLILSRLGLDLTGLDASAFMVRGAKERLANRCNFKVGNAEDLPFGDNEFDFVTLVHTLEFVDAPLPVLREAGRVASRKVFIGVINPFSWGGMTKRIRGSLGDPLFGGATLYSLWRLKSLVRQAYGQAPVSWRSIRGEPLLTRPEKAPGKDVADLRSSPFGSFIGLSVAIAYRLRTISTPLGLKVRQAGQSVMRAGTVQDLKRDGGIQVDEGSLPL